MLDDSSTLHAICSSEPTPRLPESGREQAACWLGKRSRPLSTNIGDAVTDRPTLPTRSELVG